MSNSDIPKQQQNGINIGNRLLAFLGYWSPIFSVTVGFIARKESKFALFHSIQGGLFGIIIFVLNAILNAVTALGTQNEVAGMVLTVIVLLLLAIHIIMMISAFFSKQYHLPLIGKWANSLAERWFSGD